MLDLLRFLQRHAGRAVKARTAAPLALYVLRIAPYSMVKLLLQANMRSLLIPMQTVPRAVPAAPLVPRVAQVVVEAVVAPAEAEFVAPVEAPAALDVLLRQNP